MNDEWVNIMNDRPVKLNLGSGDKPLNGYVNLDLKQGQSVYPLLLAGMGVGGVDEIRASHILEHFPHRETLSVLRDWVSWLKPGGVLKLAVPNFREIAQAYLAQEELPIEGYLMGGQTDANDFHKAVFDEPALQKLMEQVGLVNIQPWESEIQDCASLPISLNLMGTKAVPSALPETPKPVPVKIAAIMSVPRLCITNNVACLLRTVHELGIPCQPGQGVFWHHVLTRQIEDRIAEGYDYLLAIDFDSWFLPGHVKRLVELLVTHPDVDAVCAVQCMREDPLPIMAIHDEAGAPVHAMPRAWFEQELTPLHIGHFGLTVFRASCFAKLAQPWFRDEPDPQGSWRDGRKDADVAFWRNFEVAGLKLCMANEVNIGHLQEVCTFPGAVAENWKPIHVYLRDLNAGKLPTHCDPAYRIRKG
jgi:hypothetical protein